jgi:hypothetical protein
MMIDQDTKPGDLLLLRSAARKTATPLFHVLKMEQFPFGKYPEMLL